MIRALLIVALCLGAAPVLAAQGVSRAGFVLSVPPEVAGFALRDSMRYPDPALGTAYRYIAADERADVYIYPLARQDPSGRTRTDAEILQEETQAYLASLPIGVQRGWFERFQVAFDESGDLQVGSLLVPGRFAAVALRSGPRIEVSLYYVFVVHDQLVKVRSTLPQDRWPTSRAGELSRVLVETLQAQHPTPSVP